jgi:K+-sensing histidine kinase KdpD
VQSISNLCKFLVFSSQGNVTLAIEPNGKGLKFEMRDEAPRMQESVRQNLFQRLKEPSDGTKLGPGGTFHADLVLPLAAKVIESHGGTVKVEASSGNGNIFLVVVPFLDAKSVTCCQSPG